MNVKLGHMRNIRVAVFILLLTTNFLPAQVQKIVHQEFVVTDSVTQLQLEFYGAYEVESWPGNNILLELQIKLFNATQGILEHFLETGRYEVESREEGTTLYFTAKDAERRPIRTSKKGECFEDVKQRLYIPEGFVKVGEGLWQRPSRLPENMPAGSPDQQAKGIKPTGNQPEKTEGKSGND